MTRIILAAIVAGALALGALTSTPAVAHDEVGGSGGCSPWWEFQFSGGEPVWIEGHWGWRTVYVQGWGWYSYMAWNPGFWWYPQPSGGQWVYHHHWYDPSCGGFTP